VKRELGTVVRDTVEETLNKMLDAEADELCKATRYERCERRADTRAGYCKRNLDTKAGKVRLKVPKLRTIRRNRAEAVLGRRGQERVDPGRVWGQ
jgi:transposase-like protein